MGAKNLPIYKSILPIRKSDFSRFNQIDIKSPVDCRDDRGFGKESVYPNAITFDGESDGGTTFQKRAASDSGTDR